MSALTYRGKQLYLHGKPFTVISGTLHYFRIPRAYWHDRLLKLKECGFNTVETYTVWNLHEPHPGEFHFDGELDLVAFLETAAELGLYVILRPGPYICAEWEMGGLPAWILCEESMPLRCYDERFFALLRRYFGELLTRVRPHFVENGGNIIMLQVENEYGSYGDDKEYLHAIAELYRENGAECLLFTSDGPTKLFLTGGSDPRYLATANFGSAPRERFAIMDAYYPDRPHMCAEFWSGWFDHWGGPHGKRPDEEVLSCVREFLEMDASFNFYVFSGGTNFGFMNGANFNKTYLPTITSYDYGAPLSEAGDRTPLYYQIRDMLSEKYGPAPALTATETPKAAYGKLALTEAAPLFENLDRISSPVLVKEPKYMEEIGQNYGYILYRTTLRGPRGTDAMAIDVLHDRAQIFLDGKHVATWERMFPETVTENPVSFALGRNGTLDVDILVENMGRINYGPKLRDRKGIHGVRFGLQHHFDWEMYPLPMEELSGLVFRPTVAPADGPCFFRGFLEIEGTPADSFLRLDGWKKGFVTVNGKNLGRYYTGKGPQRTLYVPAPYLREGRNEVLVFESDGPVDATVEFVDIPALD